MPTAKTSTRPPVIMHVNYCEQGQTLAEICACAVRLGYDGVEFRRQRMAPGWKVIDEPVEVYLDALQKAVRTSGLKTVIFGTPGVDCATADAGKRKSEFDAAVDFYRRARDRFDFKVCNMQAGRVMSAEKGVLHGEYTKHGSAAATEEQWKWAAETFARLGDVARELGFVVAFETHMHFIHDTAQTAKKLVDLIAHPSVGVTLDYDNTLYFPETKPVTDTVAELGDKLFYVHQKNSIKLGSGRIATALSEGETNQRELLLALKKAGYGGPVCVEAPRPGDREWFARCDQEYVTSILNDIGW
jgi:sugar phosphate isomerase/epimerase